jgi:CRISPR-associated protein Csm1
MRKEETIPKKYLLKGDLNGIQEYIFNVQSKGAAKSLKARSYIIQMISHVACKFCLNELPYSTIFYDGGGNFFIEFGEDGSEIDKKVSSLQEEMNTFLCREDFAITLSYVPIKAPFGESWKDLSKQSNLLKLKRYNNCIIFFEPYDKSYEEKTLNKEKFSSILKEKSNLESGNDLYKAITDEMVKHDFFGFTMFDDTLEKDSTDFDGKLENKLPFWETYTELNAYHEYRKKNKELYPEDNHIQKGNIIDFNAMGDFAAHRTGTNKIAILKLDVDSLGSIFGAKRNRGELMNLSKRFRSFFNETLYTIFKLGTFQLSEEKEENYDANIYPIFAGGDDCFIIGSWDAALYFLSDLHDAFNKEFKNEATISAGIILISPSYPVKSFAELVDDSLSKAKKEEGKNSVCLFDMVFSWKDFKHILQTSKKLRNVMKEKKEINRSYLDKIRKSAKGFNALQNSDGIDFNKIYKLKYYLGRKDNDFKEIVELLFQPYYEALENRLLRKKGTKINVSIYPTIARITELLTKTELSYE